MNDGNDEIENETDLSDDEVNHLDRTPDERVQMEVLSSLLDFVDEVYRDGNEFFLTSYGNKRLAKPLVAKVVTPVVIDSEPFLLVSIAVTSQESRIQTISLLDGNFSVMKSRSVDKEQPTLLPRKRKFDETSGPVSEARPIHDSRIVVPVMPGEKKPRRISND